MLELEDIVQDVNRFLRSWAGYSHYGNTARHFDKITLHAINRLARMVANATSATGGTAGGSSFTNPNTAS